jgi:integrase
MARTGENIYKRKDGRWEARLILSRKNGKNRYKSVYAKTYGEVKKRLEMAVAEVGNCEEKVKNTAEITFENLAKMWLENKKSQVKESTFARYFSVLNKHIFPHWGGWLAKKITTEDMKKYVSYLIFDGLSHKTIEDILVVIKGIFRHGQKQFTAVCDFSQIAIPKTEKNIRVLSFTEQKQLENMLFTGIDRCKLGVILCLYTGLRIGELCALRGENICVSGRFLQVKSTMKRIKNLSENAENKTKIIITPPKSKKSVRDIPIPKFLLPFLKAFETPPNAYFFTGSEDFIEPRTMQNKFKNYVKKAEIKGANFHQTRHTFATNAVEQGFDVKSLS